MNVAVTPASLETASNADAERKLNYMEALRLIERLHRRLLEVIKDELERNGFEDVTSVQALLIHNIGYEEVFRNELKARGHYLGANVGYNIKKLVELDYLHYAPSKMRPHLKCIQSTEKGRALHDIVQLAYDKHAHAIGPAAGISDHDVANLNLTLLRLEDFFTDQIQFQL